MNARRLWIPGVLLVGVWLLARSWDRLSRRSDVGVEPISGSHFPAVAGSNLEGRTYQLPADFEGELNLVAVAFAREHQDLVDTWAPTAARLTAADPRLRFYEVPVLTMANRMFRPFIDGGMRAGIPSRATREATITLYTDRESFIRTIGLPGPETIALMLVDREGRIHWRGEGAWSRARERALEGALLGRR